MPTRRLRPTTEVSLVVLDSMDAMFDQLRRRLGGLTDDEYLWEPVEGMWSVRLGDGGLPTVDGAGVREIDPAPVPTIAWRLWHLAIDCLDDYTRRFGGDERDAPDVWTLDAADAVARLEQSWAAYRAVVASQDDWFAELGESWGPWSRHSIADMAMHASNELVHHGAEIALLRDLHGATFDPG